MDIREYIKQNFEADTEDEIINTIQSSIDSKDEVILPGLGVMFELIWNNVDDSKRKELISIIKKHM